MRTVESTSSFPGRIVRSEPMSAKDFLDWGVDNVAYVKPVTVKGKTTCAIHAANGGRLDTASGRDAAFVTILQHDMVPVSVH